MKKILPLFCFMLLAFNVYAETVCVKIDTAEWQDIVLSTGDVLEKQSQINLRLAAAYALYYNAGEK